MVINTPSFIGDSLLGFQIMHKLKSSYLLTTVFPHPKVAHWSFSNETLSHKLSAGRSKVVKKQKRTSFSSNHQEMKWWWSGERILTSNNILSFDFASLIFFGEGDFSLFCNIFHCVKHSTLQKMYTIDMLWIRTEPNGQCFFNTKHVRNRR